MATLLSLLCIGIGAVLVLVGLLMIAPQVRVHKIKIYSPGSWLFRAGMILTTLGILVALSGDRLRPLMQVGQLMGVAGLMGGIITAGHEWHQARDNNDVAWDWWHSLTLQMVVMGIFVLVLASIAA
jgi:hypothetical protein